MDKTINLKEYKNCLVNKEQIDNNDVSLDDLSMEELNDMAKLYKKDIKYYLDDIKKQVDLIEYYKKRNKILRKMLDD